MTRSIRRVLRDRSAAGRRCRALLVVCATLLPALSHPAARVVAADPRVDGTEGVPRGVNRPPIAPSQARQPRSDEPARTEIFGLPGEGRRIVYVVDRSASMANHGEIALDAARAEVAESLGHLHKGVDFRVLFYSDDQVDRAPAGEGLVPASPDALRRAKGSLRSVKVGGQARHFVAIDEALRLKPDLVFLITDAQPRDDLKATDVEKLLRLRETARIMITHLADDEQRCPNLAELAGKSGGRYEALSYDGSSWKPDQPAVGEPPPPASPSVTPQ